MVQLFWTFTNGVTGNSDLVVDHTEEGVNMKCIQICGKSSKNNKESRFLRNHNLVLVI